MTEPEPNPTSEKYDVILLVEQALSDADARQVRSLHEGLDEPVTYHVLMPVDDAAARVEAALGSVSGHELVPGPSMSSMPGGPDPQAAAEDAHDQAREDLDATVRLLTSLGANADGEVVTGHPVDALKDKVSAVDGREVIVLTRPHVVAEFFHVDWASQARRHLGVPVLHLLERETFDEQAGGGEGASII